MNILKNTSHLFAIIILCSLTITNVKAQSSTRTSEIQSGSIYSTFGFGSPVDVSNSAYLSQGILGLTDISKQTSNIANPAIWANTFLTHATTGVNLVQSNIEGNGQNATNFLFEPGFIHVSLPVKPGKIGLSVGLYPYTRANYVEKTVGDFLTDGRTISFNNEIQTIGGINKFEVGVGFKLTDNISIGYAPSVVFLTQTKSENFIFSEVGFRDTFQEKVYSGSSLSHRFGLTFTRSSLLNDNDKLSVGATLNAPFEIDIEESFSSTKNVSGNNESVDITRTNNSGTLSLPTEYALGIGYAPSSIVNISAEAQIQNWSEYENSLDPNSVNNMVNRLKVGFGGEYHPYKTNIGTFLSSFKYSLGVSYDTGHLSIAGEDIQTIWFNSGIGIPSRIASFIDFSFQYGIRGNSTSTVFQENIWAVGMSVSLSELMFVRPKLR